MRTLGVGSFQIVPLLRNHSLASSRQASPATKTRALGVTVAVAMAVCTAPSSVIRQALMANASPVATARAPSVRDVALPITEANDYSGSLGVLDGQIVVGDNSGGNVCRLAIVQPVTLRVLSEPSTSCNDPRLLGEDVMPVESVPSVGSPLGVVRISVRNKATGAIHLGPVVMRYENCSDCRPEWAYGGGSLWLYDVGTPSVAEVLRISLSTGAVLSTVKTPALSRVLLAPGTNGLWFAQSLESGWPSRKPRPALLYFVGNNATRPDVIPQPGDYVNWLVAAGTAAWANVQTGPNTEDITSFPTPTSLPVTVTVAATNANVPTNIGEGPSDAPPVLDDPGLGLVYAWPGWLRTLVGGALEQEILRVNTATGRSSKLIGFTTPLGALQANVVYNGAFYVLVGDQALAHATLYRVQL